MSEWLSWRRGRGPILEHSQANSGEQVCLAAGLCVHNLTSLAQLSAGGASAGAFTNYTRLMTPRLREAAQHSPVTSGIVSPYRSVLSSQHVSQPAPLFSKPEFETRSSSQDTTVQPPP
jgi:hypothetical protein